MKTNRLMCLLATVVLASFSALSAFAQTNYIANFDFSNAGPIGIATTLDTVTPNGYYSAAQAWYTWANNPGMIMTEQVASTFKTGGPSMLHVYTTCDSCGLFQPFLPANTGPDDIRFAVDVFVVQGCVEVGVGNLGQPVYVTASTCVKNNWVTLKGRNGASPANEIIIYGYGGGAEFYVALAKVSDDKTASTVNSHNK